MCRSMCSPPTHKINKFLKIKEEKPESRVERKTNSAERREQGKWVVTTRENSEVKLLKRIILLIYVCEKARVHMCVSAHLGARVTSICERLAWVLGTELLGSSAGAMRSLDP